jgi:predicted unusual protein kinase regulating ubiquinone biosynthesis (AarF/ABC1/UbiB family)
MPDATVIDQLLALLPEPLADALVALAIDEHATAAQWQATVREVLEYLGQTQQQEDIGRLVSQLLPVETLVPDIYRAWRPLVRDAVAFLSTHLSPTRLVPKLVEQILLPADTPLAQRVFMFTSQMPSLQKIGQMLARNAYLDETLRAELRQLENAIQDIAPAIIRAEIERQLGPQLTTYDVAVAEAPHAEASVSAVVRFTWCHPGTGRREGGVLKVLKPYIRAYFTEELALLQEFGTFLAANRQKYALSHMQVSELLDDVRHHLAAEIDFPQEQANLLAAAQRYVRVPGVRVPRLIPELSTPTITAMTEEPGVKVTEAFPTLLWQRQQLAMRLIEVLLAVPLFAPEQEAIFHADPHAGNLFYNQQTSEVILLDWALTQRVSREERRQLVRLMLGVVLRDEADICQALAALSPDNGIQHPAQAATVRQLVQQFVRRLSPWAFPGPTDLLTLLHTLVFAGLRLSPALWMLRKILFTLDGVLHELAPGIRKGPVIARYLLTQGTGSVSGLYPLCPPAPTFRSPLSPRDWLALSWSVCGFSSRVWRQGMALAWEAGCQALQHPTPQATSAPRP